MSKQLWWRVIIIQALLALIGSLYYSTFGDPVYNLTMGYGLFPTMLGAGLPPCDICRYVRILLYPFVWFGGYALWAKDHGLARVVLGVSVVGILLEIYQYYLQLSGSEGAFCTSGVSCADMTVAYGGWITIPLLALVAFVVTGFAAWRITKSK
ncbi:MAG: hypothetical protein H6766_01005 [Candidatus Peribacteria bacterium]|nr:MAG: hypothetical protein H6766_01005 [Candidatus Peribacteria bacterium]